MSSPSPQPRVSFGSFQVNPSTGELRRQGIRIKLHEKPLQVLLALLEHPGEVVTRKELQERLWPGDTFVEFENGLNNAISRLREALGDTGFHLRTCLCRSVRLLHANGYFAGQRGAGQG